ncbi:hypothetical protein F3Y22_tig00111640pilonHSYRG00248 [Hibiscus syriacus]|uniref:Protein kinase domain-containing protein n=1 Tax=Hibiscus syriacus TaxID=106335 RepID=A0A6A2XKE1_HIBSY|nr:hypothetical protein F3Y22_tig00111640pilonHSYRG00248 [Hibiscus syriacus]
MKSSSGTPEQNRAIISDHQQALVTTSPLVKTEKTTPSSQLCFSFNDCLGKGSIASTNPHRLQQGKQQRPNRPTSNLEQQVAELEKEVQKQREVRTMYKMKMERTQDYLRYSLQIAHDKGFLDHIIKRKSPISRDVALIVDTSAPQPLPASPSHQSDLCLLIGRAKLNGWFIDPRELMGACLEPPMRGWIVTELLSMTLRDWLHGPGNNRKKGRATPLPQFEERLSKAVEIAQAMQYLHEQKPKIIHRDLKPSNISWTMPSISGWPISAMLDIIRCEPYNEKSDVYSFGIILNELITGDHPYIETNYGPAKIALEVGEGKLRPALPEDNGELGEVIELICQSWDEDASVRPTFATITFTLSNFQTTFKEKYCLLQYSSLH